MRPPGYLRALARVLIPRRDREFIVGDLDELWSRRVSGRGRLSADVRYVADVLASALARARGARPRHRPRRRLVEPRTEGPLAGLRGDLRRAIRSLHRRPGFTLLVVVTVALGVGPTAAVFGMIDQLLLSPLPGVANTRTAGYLRFTSGEPSPQSSIPVPAFEALRDQATLLRGAAAYGSMLPAVSLDDERPVLIDATLVYGDYFDALGVAPSEGRLLAAVDTEVGAEQLVAVISERLRDDLFGPGADAAGRVIRLDGESVRVVGVAAGAFGGAERGSETDAWLPYGALFGLRGESADRLRNRSVNQFLILPRPGVSFEAAEEQVASILAGLARSGADGSEDLSELRPIVFGGLHTPPLVRQTTSDTLRMMVWAVALILAIACANVANLLLFRNVAQRGMVATRRALGASTTRIAREQLAESMVLGTLGAFAGIGVAWLIALPFRGSRLMRMPALEGFALDWSMVGFLGVIAVTTVLLFGVAPAALAARFDLGAALRASQMRDTGRLGRLRATLSVGQLGLTLALVAGGLLMVRTIANLNDVGTGLDIEGVAALPVVSRTSPPADQIDAIQRRVLAAVGEVPEVEAAALDLYGPHGSRLVGRIRPEGSDEAQEIQATVWPVTPGWFDVFRVSPIHGRTFEDQDWDPSGGPAGVVLTASLARQLFGSTDVTGRMVLVRLGASEPMRVLGVIADYTSMASPAEPTDAFFITYDETPFTIQMTVMARTTLYGPDVADRLREAVESALPGVPVPDPVLLEDRVDGLHQEERVLGRLLGILSAFALVLSAVGLYGVIAFMVSHRAREFGIRRALGADGASIIRLVSSAGLAILVTGTLLGLGGAYALARVLQSRLFGVAPLDVASYAGASALLACVVALACLAPARAALRVDPVATLRQE